MKLLIVRHAEPDYAVDGLTPKGHREAEMLAKRLAPLPVTAYYQSPLGRAQLTAGYTLRACGRTAETLPWLREFRGSCPDPVTGKTRICWDQRPEHWEGRSMLYSPEEWVRDDLMQGGDVEAQWNMVRDGIDELLARHGYRREGLMYRCDDNRDDTIVLFCHFAVGTVLMSRILNMPPLPMLQTLCMAPSSVTTLTTEERKKGLVVFRCNGYGDISHLYAGNEKPSTAGMFCECYDGRDTTVPIEWERNGK